MQAISEIHEEGDEVRFGSLKPVKKFFVYKCKLSLSLELPYLVDLFINNFKTKCNNYNLFYRMILIHNSFWRNFPARAKQTPSKVLFVAKKKQGDCGCLVIARQKL